ncbi:hypothetical protein [Pseudomonas sp. MWU16-30323]|jgi:hypothetical protein|uniref:hypothetical protein n=1 Tax=Pseudomonas sp. MWU16-30323 TaxID=2878094 RepID=UPI001CFA5305|nr:hypothetical protein [Pseudomonas sp. MWU16-30323]
MAAIKLQRQVGGVIDARGDCGIQQIPGAIFAGLGGEGELQRFLDLIGLALQLTIRLCW